MATMKMKHIKETEVAPVLSEQQKRLEYLRGELRAERISTGELVELQSLVQYISPGDVELLEAAGVPENAPVSGQHTPTPWQVAYYGESERAFIQVGPLKIASIIYQDDGNSNTITHANAAFIVRACNCHEELVKALQDLLSADQMPPCEKQTELAIVAMKQARAALNKAIR